MSKPHRGTIKNWARSESWSHPGRYVIVGVSHGHPEFHGGPIRTSLIEVERPEINEVETLNSRYSLEQPALSAAPPGPEFVTLEERS